MPINVELEALLALDFTHESCQGLVLRLRASTGTTVCLVARVRGSTRAAPFVVPVAVVISTTAVGVSVLGAVLAPHTIVGLGEDEAIGVNNGDNVNVILVKHSSDIIVLAVVGKERLSNELESLGGDPFTGVNVRVEDGSRLGSLGGSVDVKTEEIVSFPRPAGRNNSRVRRVLGLKILEPGNVFLVWVESVEPGIIE